MTVADCVEQLFHYISCIVLIQALALFDFLEQIPASHILCDNIEVIFILEPLMDLYNIWVILLKLKLKLYQFFQDFYLINDWSNVLLFTVLWELDNFHRPYIPSLFVSDLLDLAEASIPYYFQDFVVLVDLSIFLIDKGLLINAYLWSHWAQLLMLFLFLFL